MTDNKNPLRESGRLLAIMLHNFLRASLGLVFVGTGVVKLMDVPGFARHLGEFGIVADALVPAVAWLICLAELAAGLGLVANVRGSLVAVSSMLVLFIGALVYGITLGLDIDCGCLGPAFSVSLRTQLLIDAALLAVCGLIHLTRRQPDVRSEGPAALPVAATNPSGEST